MQCYRCLNELAHTHTKYMGGAPCVRHLCRSARPCSSLALGKWHFLLWNSLVPVSAWASSGLSPADGLMLALS